MSHTAEERTMLWRRTYFTLVSPHSPQECVERIKAITVSPYSGLGFGVLFSDQPFVGWVSYSGIRVSKNGQGRRNSMQPMFKAELEPYGNGTRLDCRLGLPTPVLVVVTMLALALALVALGTLTAYIRNNASTGGVQAAVFMPLVTIGMILYGRWLAQGEREFLEATLSEHLDARRE